MASLDVWKVPSLLFSSWFYCLISEAANVFFFLILIQHLKFEKPIFNEMQLLKNTRFSWGTQCLVLRYELNAYVNKITWVPHPCCGFTNLSSKSLVSFTFHTQLTFMTLGSATLLGHPSVRKRALGKPTNKMGWDAWFQKFLSIFAWLCSFGPVTRQDIT